MHCTLTCFKAQAPCDLPIARCAFQQVKSVPHAERRVRHVTTLFNRFLPWPRAYFVKCAVRRSLPTTRSHSTFSSPLTSFWRLSTLSWLSSLFPLFSGSALVALCSSCTSNASKTGQCTDASTDSFCVLPFMHIKRLKNRSVRRYKIYTYSHICTKVAVRTFNCSKSYAPWSVRRINGPWDEAVPVNRHNKMGR